MLSNSRTFTVTKFVLSKIGSLFPQYRRPYQTFLDREVLDHILENVKDRTKITPAAMALVTEKFMSVNGRAEGPTVATEDYVPVEVVIPNGWAADRYRFELVVESTDSTGLTRFTQTVLGYTDHATPLEDGSFDPSTKFYINSVHSQRKFIRQEGEVLVSHVRMVDSTQLLRNPSFVNMGAEEQLYTLSPESIFGTIETRQMFPDEGTIIDGRTRVTGLAQRSKRANASPAHYVSSVLDAYINCRNYGEDNVHEVTSGIVQSGSLGEDPLLDALRRQTPGTAGEFVLANLVAVAREAAIEIKTVPGAVPTFLETDKWDTASMNVRWAAALSQALPALMVEHDFLTFGFSATNTDSLAHGGSLYIQPFNVGCFGDQQPNEKVVQALLFQIEHVLLKGLSQGNAIGYSVIVTSDLGEATTVELKLHDGKQTVHVSPTFADALFSPLVTRDKNLLEANAHDWAMLLDSIDEQLDDRREHPRVHD